MIAAVVAAAAETTTLADDTAACPANSTWPQTSQARTRRNTHEERVHGDLPPILVATRQLMVFAFLSFLSAAAPLSIFTAEGWFHRRDNTIDESSGAAHWSFLPALLNSGVFSSWSSRARAEDANSFGTSDDLLATRVYAERGSQTGLTPPSISMAYFANSSDYSFDYSAIGFIDGNTGGGDFTRLVTLSVTQAFEFNDTNGDGTFQPHEPILSSFDLSTLVWDTPCSSAGVNATESSDALRFLNLTSVVFNAAHSNLTFDISVAFGSDPTQLGVEASDSQGLVLASKNVIFSAGVRNYDYVGSPESGSLLALNFTILMSRTDSTSDDDATDGTKGDDSDATMVARYIDLTGKSGQDGGRLPAPTLNPLTNTTDRHEQLRNTMISGKDTDQIYVAWNNVHEVTHPGENATERHVALSYPTNSTLEAFELASPGGSTMFLTDDTTSHGPVVVKQFVLAFSTPQPSAVRLALSVGFGRLPLPGTDPLTNETTNYIIAACLVGSLLLLAVICLIFGRYVKPPNMGEEEEEEDAEASKSTKSSTGSVIQSNAQTKRGYGTTDAGHSLLANAHTLSDAMPVVSSSAPPQASSDYYSPPSESASLVPDAKV